MNKNTIINTGASHITSTNGVKFKNILSDRKRVECVNCITELNETDYEELVHISQSYPLSYKKFKKLISDFELRNKLGNGIGALANAFNMMEISTDKAIEVANALAELAPPITENDIELIKMNPTLSIFRKWLLIRDVKKYLKENENR